MGSCASLHQDDQQDDSQAPTDAAPMKHKTAPAVAAADAAHTDIPSSAAGGAGVVTSDSSSSVDTPTATNCCTTSQKCRGILTKMKNVPTIEESDDGIDSDFCDLDGLCEANTTSGTVYTPKKQRSANKHKKQASSAKYMKRVDDLPDRGIPEKAARLLLGRNKSTKSCSSTSSIMSTMPAKAARVLLGRARSDSRDSADCVRGAENIPPPLTRLNSDLSQYEEYCRRTSEWCMEASLYTSSRDHVTSASGHTAPLGACTANRKKSLRQDSGIEADLEEIKLLCEVIQNAADRTLS